MTDCPLDLGREQPVRQLVLDLIGQQVVACPEGSLCVPSRPHECIVWDSSVASTGALKVVVDRRVSAGRKSCERVLTRNMTGLSSRRVGVL